MNKKTLIAAAGVLLLGGNAYATRQHDSDVRAFCHDWGKMAEVIAQDRDKGISERQEKDSMLKEDAPPEVMLMGIETVDKVYGEWRGVEPGLIRFSLNAGCMEAGEATGGK